MSADDQRRRLSSFKVLTFDCYGTLVDWASGVNPSLEPLSRFAPTKVPIPQIIQLLHTFERENFVNHPTMPYDQIMLKTYDQTAERLGIACSFDPSQTAPEIFMGRQSINKTETWPAFPDSVDALNKLQKEFGYKLMVLSNITVDMFDKTLKTALKDVKFDKVYTAQEIGSYKPDKRNFEYLLNGVKEEFGFEKDEVLHIAHGVSSDHVTCKSMGIESCWISRGVKDVDDDVKKDVAFGWRFDSMGEMVEAVAKEGGSEGVIEDNSTTEVR